MPRVQKRPGQNVRFGIELFKGMTAGFIGKKLNPGVFGKIPERKKFLADKKMYLGFLQKGLKKPKGDRSAIEPVIGKCLIELNKFPFLYTYDCRWAMYGKSKWPKELLLTPPKGAKSFYYRAPFISIRLNGSKRSLLFWQRFAEFTQKHQNAMINPPDPSTSFEILATRSLNLLVKTTPNQKRKMLAEATEFFKELTKFAKEFQGI